MSRAGRRWPPGFPDHVPAYTVNRFCASSLTAMVNLANSIAVGELELGVAAGVESMSRSGWALMKGEAPFAPRGPVFMLDTMWPAPAGRRTRSRWPARPTWR
jgi:acetyl-CoA acetyltransferase